MTTLQRRSEDLRPRSLDERGRTVEATLATSTPVARMDPSGPYQEILQVDGQSVDLSALPVPLLDHHRGDARSTVGTVTRAWIENPRAHGRRKRAWR
jgi:hypothetical protein